MDRFNYFIYGNPTVTAEFQTLQRVPLATLSRTQERVTVPLRDRRDSCYNYDLVYRPGTSLVVADTLSRAHKPTTAAAAAVTNAHAPEMQFYEELAACSETEQIDDLHLVASETTMQKLRRAAQCDDAYRMLIAMFLFIAHSDGFENQLKTLRDLFERVKRANLKTKPSKTRICYTEVEFLGHTISSGSIRPMQTNVEKLINAPTPKTKKRVRSLLGAVGFLRKFIPNCAEILKPLKDLTGKIKPDKAVWQAEQQNAFDKVKRVLTSEREPVFKLYRRDREHVLQTDACHEQIAATLLQREEDGELHPVMYASRKLLHRKVRYAIPDKEGLAVFWAVNKFYKYLFGSRIHVFIQTD